MRPVCEYEYGSIWLLLDSDFGVGLVAYLLVRQGLMSTVLLSVWLFIFGGVKFYIGAI
jgi:hypothetical protein